jgi:hypothetical protein
VESVDQSMSFVEFVTEIGHPAPGNYSGVTLYSPRAAFGGFHLFGDFVNVGVQRLQQLPRLRRVGVIDHVRIIAPTPKRRAPRVRSASAQFNVEPARRASRELLPRQRSPRSLLTLTKNLWRSAVLVSQNVLRLTYGLLHHELLTPVDGNGNITSQRIMRCR